MALTCKLSNNILRTTQCGYSLPEIVEIYLANFDEVVSSDTASASGGCGEEITAITMASGATFYKIEPAKNTATFEDTLVVEDNGNKYRNHSLTFSIVGAYDSCMHQNLDDLALGKYFAVVKTADGRYLALGRLTGLEAETATLSGGGDNNGIQVILSANVAESTIPLAGSAVAQVVGS